MTQAGPQINFYHLTTTPLEKALPKLLERALETKKHTVVLGGSDAEVSMLNQLLWTYSTLTFLPHGTKEEGYAARQPIYITTEEENPNQAEILCFHGTREPRFIEGFTKALYLFDGNDPSQISFARNLWKSYKQSGYDMSYWKQTGQGGWEQQDLTA